MIRKLTPQNFELVSGNDKDVRFTTLDQDDIAVDITGATIIWALARSAKNKSALFTYTSPTNIAITNGLAGKFTVSIQDTDTLTLKAGKYYHEARVTSAAGKKITVAYGEVDMLDNVIDT